MNPLKHWPQTLTVLAAAIGGTAVNYYGLRSDKYTSRELSVYQPSSWVFSVVWTFIYFTYWYVWQNIVDVIPTYLNVIFYINMALNLLWSVAFFGLFNFWLSFVIICLLGLVLAVQIYLLFRLRIPKSGLHLFLLLIYLSWIIVATVLNYNFLE